MVGPAAEDLNQQECGEQASTNDRQEWSIEKLKAHAVSNRALLKMLASPSMFHQ